MSRLQALKLVHVSFLHFLCIWHFAQLSLLAILYYFLNQTLKNKIKFHRTNILNFAHSPGAVYTPNQTSFSMSYLLATNYSTTETLNTKKYLWGKEKGRCLLSIFSASNGFLKDQLKYLIGYKSVIR